MARVTGGGTSHSWRIALLAHAHAHVTCDGGGVVETVRLGSGALRPRPETVKDPPPVRTRHRACGGAARLSLGAPRGLYEGIRARERVGRSSESLLALLPLPRCHPHPHHRRPPRHPHALCRPGRRPRMPEAISHRCASAESVRAAGGRSPPPPRYGARCRPPSACRRVCGSSPPVRRLRAQTGAVSSVLGFIRQVCAVAHS